MDSPSCLLKQPPGSTSACICLYRCQSTICRGVRFSSVSHIKQAGGVWRWELTLIWSSLVTSHMTKNASPGPSSLTSFSKAFPLSSVECMHGITNLGYNFIRFFRKYFWNRIQKLGRTCIPSRFRLLNLYKGYLVKYRSAFIWSTIRDRERANKRERVNEWETEIKRDWKGTHLHEHRTQLWTHYELEKKNCQKSQGFLKA